MFKVVRKLAHRTWIYLIESGCINAGVRCEIPPGEVNYLASPLITETETTVTETETTG